MSLDVYLTLKGQTCIQTQPGIFVRENGGMKQLSREEWDQKFPGIEPVVMPPTIEDDTEVYWGNITHNLNTMAAAAGVYQTLWRPDEIGIEKAQQLIEPLRKGLETLRADPERFKKFNPSNKWGSYGGLVNFISEYLAACEQYPDATVNVSR